MTRGMARSIVAAGLLAGSWAGADEIWLKGGGRIVGEIVERRAQSVVVDVGPGTVSLPMARVERIVSATSNLSEYRSRAALLAHSDVQGWIALATWAEDNDLRTQARDAWRHVLAIQPSSVIAHQALGHVQYGGRWMERADAMRAQGLVEYDGQWITPSEREARVRLAAADAAARHESAVADARVAEAEARAREAEARARAAEADAARAADYSDDGGIPLIGYGAVGIGAPLVVDPDPFCCDPPPHTPRTRPRHRPPAPQPTPVPSDRGKPIEQKSNTRGTAPPPKH